MSFNCNNDSSNFYLNDRKFLGVAEVINILDHDQPETQIDVRDISMALRWIGMDLKLPHLNLTDHQLRSTIDEVKTTTTTHSLFFKLS
jgi:hypothetical protein